MSVQVDKFYNDLRTDMATTASLQSDRFTEGDFRIGGVLNRTWLVLSRNFLAFFLVTAIADMPDVLFNGAGHGRVTAIIAVFVSEVMRRLTQSVVLYGAPCWSSPPITTCAWPRKASIPSRSLPCSSKPVAA
jgi:hypothetical protein